MKPFQPLFEIPVEELTDSLLREVVQTVSVVENYCARSRQKVLFCLAGQFPRALVVIGDLI